MKYEILQLDRNNINVIADGRMYESWNYLNKKCGFSKLCYKKVYEGEIGSEGKEIWQILEDLFTKFNCFHPNDFHGHSLSTSDVVVLDGVMYYCDSFGWVNIETEEKL